MKKFIKMYIIIFCTFTVTTVVIICGWENSKALAENNKLRKNILKICTICEICGSKMKILYYFNYE